MLSLSISLPPPPPEIPPSFPPIVFGLDVSSQSPPPPIILLLLLPQAFLMLLQHLNNLIRLLINVNHIAIFWEPAGIRTRAYRLGVGHLDRSGTQAQFHK